MSEIVLAPLARRIIRDRGTFRAPAGLPAALESYTVGADFPGGITARVDRGRVSHEQGYLLEVGADSVSLIAADRAGLFYGLMTLRQLLRQAGQRGVIHCVRIEDWPEYPVRGIMLDISRNRVPTMETLRRLIDFWAELKYNQLQLYMEHTFAYPSHRTVWREASPLSPDEVEELDRYCAGRSIELVPNQNSFGHMERWLKHPEYRYLAETTEGFPDPWGGWRTQPTTLDPLHPGSIDLLSGLYDELLPHFSSSMLNVGADEPIDLGYGRSAEACHRHGTGRVYLDFLLKIYEQVSKRGHTMQFCSDFILHYPELIRELPRDAIAINWGYEADHPFERESRAFAVAGIPFYVCPGTSSWNSLGGRWNNARENIRRAARAGKAQGAAGFLLTDWGDNGHWQQLPISLPAYIYGSAVSWSGPGGEDLDVAKCLSLHFFQDATDAAESLLLLGSACDDGIVRLPNAGILAVLLLEDLEPYYRKAFELYRGYDFSREQALLEKARRLAGSSAVGAEDAALLAEEMTFTADLMIFASRLGKERFATSGISLEEIPVSIRRGLAEELAELIRRFRKLWLARSRPGGLRESSGRMEALRDKCLQPGS